MPAGTSWSGDEFCQPCGDAGGEKGGGGRGECGLLIGSVRGRNGRAFNRIEAEKSVRRFSYWSRFWSREEEPDRWVPPVGEGE
jgi:hypothetical protein